MKINVTFLIGQTVATFLIFALALFLPVGTVTWLPGWIFLGLFFAWFIALNAWLFKHNPGLLQERMKLGRSDQKGWDKVLFPLLLLFSVGWLVFISFDAGRFHWSHVSLLFQVIGAAVLLWSFALFFLTFRENSFLSTVVRVQEDRGHRVVSSGPYSHVRHPMYAAILIFVMGTPMLLGSWYGVLLGLLYMVVLGRRAVLEERTLQKELPGYAEYMTKVKYRIVPYLW
jgi:protein-S-isoprenylcysteine O-methyltransferase Ste14